jgi:hypothetical protein
MGWAEDSSAAICRANGWGVGDILEGEEYGRIAQIRITAIGEEGVLAREIAGGTVGFGWNPVHRPESSWSLAHREWTKVDPGSRRVGEVTRRRANGSAQPIIGK